MKLKPLKKDALKQSVAIFIPVILLLAILAAAVLYQHASDELLMLEKDQDRIVRIQENIIKHEFEMITSDLQMLSLNESLRAYLDTPEAAIKSALTQEFLTLSAHKQRYDQIRYLDATGREVIRVDYRDGMPAITPEVQLQSKADRYYFTDTIKLNRGAIFVSPFDLNIDHGVIEKPLKPMIRFAMPLFNSQGEKRGILILNYLGNELFQHMEGIGKLMSSRVNIMLLNQQGYWLKGPLPEVEWGFMYNDEKRAFSHTSPQSWQQILSSRSGGFSNEEGLFTFRTIYPLLSRLSSSTGSSSAAGTSKGRVEGDGYFWKLVVYVPTDHLSVDTRKLFNEMIPFVLVITIMFGVGSIVLARLNVRRILDEEHIQRLAHYDNLTGLPNRVLMYDRITQLVARTERYQSAFAVMFIDLDGFKAVNDNHGHDAGDAVLKEAAARILHQIRKLDTVSRIGGDEFLVVLTDVTEHDNAKVVAEKIIASFAAPFEVGEDLSVAIGASIGISIYPEDGRVMDTLIKYADKAMYKAKMAGKNGYRFYSG